MSDPNKYLSSSRNRHKGKATKKMISLRCGCCDVRLRLWDNYAGKVCATCRERICNACAKYIPWTGLVAIDLQRFETYCPPCLGVVIETLAETD